MNQDPVDTAINRQLSTEKEYVGRLNYNHDAINRLARLKVAAEISKRGDLYTEALSGEGLDFGETAVLAGHILSVFNIEGDSDVKNLLCQDLGKVILAQVVDYILPGKLEEAEEEIMNG